MPPYVALLETQADINQKGKRRIYVAEAKEHVLCVYN
jgi:hypothetical protein